MSPSPMLAEVAASLRDLRRVPGIGISLAQDLLNLGITSVHQLSEADPDELYQSHSLQQGQHVDRCVLYAFRCAIYFARHERAGSAPDPEKLKWWNWKDAPGAAAKIRRASFTPRR